VSRILVTGSAGFIGRVLVARLRESGFGVIEFDQAEGDISRPDALLKYADFDISHVFHLAGKTFVPESWKNPHGFFLVNTMGTVNVLEFCRNTSARLTYVSSYLYGEPDYLPVDELHPLKSYNPYSQSKQMAESVCRFYAENYRVSVTVLRPFNAYGPGQSKVFLIGEIIEKVLNPGVPAVEVMDLRPRRDYVYVDDLVCALIHSMDAPDGVYNIGSGYSKSVGEIIELVMALTGISKEVLCRNVVRPNEILDLYADIRKAGRDLGWEPRVPFEKGLENCIRDHRQTHKKF
jgi:nucleoside-diphosphate-sugar epimerase